MGNRQKKRINNCTFHSLLTIYYSPSSKGGEHLWLTRWNRIRKHTLKTLFRFKLAKTWTVGFWCYPLRYLYRDYTFWRKLFTSPS